MKVREYLKPVDTLVLDHPGTTTERHGPVPERPLHTLLRDCLSFMRKATEFEDEEGSLLYVSVWNRKRKSRDFCSHGWQCIRQADNFLVEELERYTHSRVWSVIYELDEIDKIIPTVHCVAAKEVNLSYPDEDLDMWHVDEKGNWR